MKDEPETEKIVKPVQSENDPLELIVLEVSNHNPPAGSHFHTRLFVDH
jgi:hypothetical protein